MGGEVAYVDVLAADESVPTVEIEFWLMETEDGL